MTVAQSKKTVLEEFLSEEMGEPEKLAILRAERDRHQGVVELPGNLIDVTLDFDAGEAQIAMVVDPDRAGHTQKMPLTQFFDRVRQTNVGAGRPPGHGGARFLLPGAGRDGTDHSR